MENEVSNSIEINESDDYGTKILKQVLKDFENMSKEDYLKLYKSVQKENL